MRRVLGSLKYGQYSQSSRLASRAPRSATYATNHWNGLFEWYAAGNTSLKALTKKAAAAGLTNRLSGKPLVRARIHQLLQDPIYSGDFMWLGRLYEVQHKPLIGRDLFERVQRVFVAANHPPHATKRQHSFVGLVKCALCGAPIRPVRKRE
jgi:hypothetical protein